MTRTRLAAGFLLLWIDTHPVIAGTCALCRQSLAASGQNNLIQGFYWSILLILGVSMIILGFGIYYVRRFWSYRP